MEIVLYETEQGKSPFADWFNDLDAPAALKVRTAMARIEAGNLGDVRAVGGGIFERRIDWGPGYRLYFGREGDRLVVLLAAGTKRRQSADIARAQANWADYRNPKKG